MILISLYIYKGDERTSDLGKWAAYLESSRNKLNNHFDQDDDELDELMNELDKKHDEMKDYLRRSARVKFEQCETDTDCAFLVCSESAK